MKTSELMELGAAELATKLCDTQKELAELKLRHASKVEVEKPARMRSLRRDIARMMTIQNALKKEAK